MGLVDGFAKGVALGNDIERTNIAREDSRLAKIQAEKDSAFREWQRDYTKRTAADKETTDRLQSIEFGIGKGQVPNDDDLKFLNDNLDLTDPVTRSLFDDNTRRQQARAVDTLAKRFAGQNIPKSEMLDAGNILYGDQVGEGKTLSDFFPDPEGKGLVFSLNVDGVEGKKPLTKYRLTEEDGDNEVKVIPFADLASDVQKRSILIRAIEAKRVRLGDKAPIASAAEKAKLQEQRVYDRLTEAEKRAYDALGEAQKQKFQMEKLNKEYELKGGLERNKARNKKSEPVKLTDTMYKQFNGTIMDEMIRRYGLNKDDLFDVDAMGNQRVDEDRFYGSLPPEGQQAWQESRRLGENFMVDGFSPVNAAMSALEKAYGKPAAQGQAPPLVNAVAQRVQAGNVDYEALAKDIEAQLAKETDEQARWELIQQISKVSPELNVAMNNNRKGLAAAGARDKASVARQENYQEKRQPQVTQAGYVSPPELENPQDVRSAMFTNMQNVRPEYADKIVDAAINLAKNAGSAYVSFVKSTPVGLAAAGIKNALQEFRTWAQTRYKSPQAIEDPAVLVEYAKENPKAAEQIIASVK